MFNPPTPYRDGGVALAAYLAQYHESRKGSLSLLHEKLLGAKDLKVLELGTGCGIVGLTLAALRKDCQVLLTDLESAQEIIQRNLEMCRTQLQGKVTFQVFDWSDLEPPMLCPDIILIADCTYNDCLAELVGAIERCVGGSTDTIIVLAHKRRHDSELAFFELMAKRFEIAHHSDYNTASQGRLDNQDVPIENGVQGVDLYTFKLLESLGTGTGRGKILS